MLRSKTKNDPQIAEKEERQSLFLTHYREFGTIRQSCEKIGIHRNTYHKWIREDPQFVVDFELAKEDSNDSLLKEAHRRAIRGTSEPIYYKGKKVGSRQWHSDSLLMFLMKANDPGKYRENGNDGKGSPRPGGDRMKMHIKQEVVSDEKMGNILCDLEEALADAGVGSKAD